jgi:Zn-dependent peptidase ImmA (M78 family)
METTDRKISVGISRNLARKLLQDAGIKQIPVSLAIIVNHLKARYDLEVQRFPLGAIDGLLVMVNDLPTIGFNGDAAWVRRRFTIAHEIGHLLLGHMIDRDDTAETEAHQFAAELLMPLAFLKTDFKNLRDLEQLARKYIVSKEALCWHLMDCRLL